MAHSLTIVEPIWPMRVSKTLTCTYNYIRYNEHKHGVDSSAITVLAMLVINVFGVIPRGLLKNNSR